MRPIPVLPATGKSAEALLSELLLSVPAQRHLENLHTMLVGWLRENRRNPAPEKVQEDVYLTYFVIKNLLTEITRA